ncbi:MAG TPA: hypothetical protein PK299_04400 [Anaerolineales bacterium]|nr:hypothetical protein [Anaerolineales bacterium]
MSPKTNRTALWIGGCAALFACLVIAVPAIWILWEAVALNDDPAFVATTQAEYTLAAITAEAVSAQETAFADHLAATEQALYPTATALALQTVWQSPPTFSEDFAEIEPAIWSDSSHLSEHLDNGEYLQESDRFNYHNLWLAEPVFSDVAVSLDCKASSSYRDVECGLLLSLTPANDPNGNAASYVALSVTGQGACRYTLYRGQYQQENHGCGNRFLPELTSQVHHLQVIKVGNHFWLAFDNQVVADFAENALPLQSGLVGFYSYFGQDPEENRRDYGSVHADNFQVWDIRSNLSK